MCFQMLDRHVPRSESICHNPVIFSSQKAMLAKLLDFCRELTLSHLQIY